MSPAMGDPSAIAFGIGALRGDVPAVVVGTQVRPLADIVARHTGAPAPAPATMKALLADWTRWHGWLRGLGLDPEREEGWRPQDSMKFGPPVAEPWNIFQTYHNYQRPSRVHAGRMDPPKEVRVLPDVFMGSRSALAAYGDPVLREHGGTQFDFEVELCAVVGREAYRVPADKAEAYLAGYCIANDYTMHHAWWRPIRKNSSMGDNLRMKNFPGYTPLSRAIVPADLVGDPHDLAVRAWVDGELRQDTRTNAMLWHVEELVEYLSHIVPLRPGDLIICGSPEELPLPEGRERGLPVGCTMTAEMEKLGRLVNTIGEQDFRQPNER